MKDRHGANRLFLDAHIPYSAAYGSRGLLRLWERAEQGVCVLVASGYVIEEARRNLGTDGQRGRLTALLRQVEVVDDAPANLPCPLPLPEKDRPVLMAALTARATHLLTGDALHFGAYFDHFVHGIRILPPASYLAHD